MSTFVFSFFYPPQGFAGANYLNPKTCVRFAQVTDVECDNGDGLSIDRSLQHQFVSRISELGPPSVERSHRLGHCNESIDINANLSRTQLRSESVFCPRTNGLVFKSQSHSQKHRSFAAVDAPQQLG
jgi:hypothetical protein